MLLLFKKRYHLISVPSEALQYCKVTANLGQQKSTITGHDMNFMHISGKTQDSHTQTQTFYYLIFSVTLHEATQSQTHGCMAEHLASSDRFPLFHRISTLEMISSFSVSV
jgi:hypothetical protein